jgi:hypothetical protein
MRIFQFVLFIFITWLSLLGQPSILFADYVMLCTFVDNTIARVYNVSDQGDIQYDYTLDIGSEPNSVCFSPNGHWGMIGCNTISTKPETQQTVILGVDENIKISVLGSVHNEYHWLVSISPDSHYGVYGFDLKSIRFYPDNTYVEIPNDNPLIASFYAPFSKLNFNFYVENNDKKITECTLSPDGRTTTTGQVINIIPSTGAQDVNVSPDGKTCIALSIIKYRITVLRIHQEGGASIVQQFNTISTNPYVVDFTPDSKYALVSFVTSPSEYPDLIIYSIGPDSLLTETDSVILPNDPGEEMAVTPDGKFAITRCLILEPSGPRSYFYVVRIHEDGTLEYLPEKDYNCSGFVSAIAFVPPRITSAGNSWIMY